MTYHSTRDYDAGERYYILFKDVDGNNWKVSIQDPNFVGTPIQLTGGVFPVTWEGEGDESQTEVVLGTTGHISIICNQGQESLFAVGNILPSEINERRVQVCRWQYAFQEWQWIPYWQGFIKPEVLTQDWDSSPYEIEIPILSAVAAMEYFVMPLPGQHGGSFEAYSDLFEGVTNIANLIRAIIAATGCDFRRIITNWPYYRDMTGNIVMIPNPSSGLDYPMHWTQGKVSSLFFYDIEEGVMKPKTFKDVLEHICYPYGKIHEYYKDFAIVMRKATDAYSDMRIQVMPVWNDYTTGSLATSVLRFEDDVMTVPVVRLEDIMTEGSDNSRSNISAPSLVSFTNNIEEKKGIFELSDKFIKPTLPLGDSPAGLPIRSVDLDEDTRYLYRIDGQYIDSSFADDWTFHNSGFCRVIDVIGESNDKVTYETTAPLAFCFNTRNLLLSSIQFTPLIGFRSFPTRNSIKMTLKCWFINDKDPFGGDLTHGIQIFGRMRFKIQDAINRKFLYYNEDNKWVWVETEPAANLIKNMNFENGECSLFFNESRTQNDSAPHHLIFYFDGFLDDSDTENYGQLFLTFKLEYVKDTTFYQDVLMGEFGKPVLNNGDNKTLGGNGDEINVNFRTLAGKNRTVDGSMMLAQNSFCDAKIYIDTEVRDKIEIDSARFEKYSHGVYDFDLVTSYAVVTDNDKVFIPVAVGMNPRMNTLKLRLVSTNVN